MIASSLFASYLSVAFTRPDATATSTCAPVRRTDRIVKISVLSILSAAACRIVAFYRFCLRAQCVYAIQNIERFRSKSDRPVTLALRLLTKVDCHRHLVLRKTDLLYGHIGFQINMNFIGAKIDNSARIYFNFNTFLVHNILRLASI